MGNRVTFNLFWFPVRGWFVHVGATDYGDLVIWLGRVWFSVNWRCRLCGRLWAARHSDCPALCGGENG